MFYPFSVNLHCQDDVKLNWTFDEGKHTTHINCKTLDIINNASLNTINEVSPLVISEIATFIYCIHLGPIFVEYFMNKTKKIPIDNIGEREILVKNVYVILLVGERKR